jgi:hypothetical protein
MLCPLLGLFFIIIAVKIKSSEVHYGTIVDKLIVKDILSDYLRLF